MKGALRTSVAIVGGGAVGLMLALFLDRHGVESVVFHAEDTWHAEPHGNAHSPRTMEYCRRLGIAAPIRRLGLPAGHPADIAYFTRFGGHELSRLPLACRGLRMRQAAAAAATDQTPEPVLRADQMYVEKFLYEHVLTRPNITVRHGRHITALEQNAERVKVLAQRADGPAEQWTARYAVGCDGGHSHVRRAVGVHHERCGSHRQRTPGHSVTAAHLRLPTFHHDVVPGRRAWTYWALNNELRASLTALNGRDEFFLLADAPTPAPTPPAAGPDRLVDVVRRAAGVPLPVEVLGRRPGTPDTALIAQRFTIGRVLLAGDAAHPFACGGGFGMNTGVDDAANLAWKLAAVLQGWGGPGLLATYEAERRPVARRNAAAAGELGASLDAVELPAALEEDSPQGERTRVRAGDLLRSHGERTHALGVHLGARYDGSPIVAGDGEPPADSWGTYVPSSVPGGRAPHLWLDEWHGQGSSLFDRFGPGFTLLRLGSGTPSSKPLEAAAQAYGMPLTVLDVDVPCARELYEHDLVLIRPDQHVAWRGNQLPTDPDGLVAQVTGVGRSGARGTR
ncbi:FAD-dependent monooxygenase [Streptomyces monashensis]|uniref:Monooxygenase n=1 Tax=Streptomyces monashensis TaxID=1678012 RepID=A0A1S2PTF1_9ACTN|nr:FAD-dependent monooxygenase [Streptomyces monashensis]OIJ97043.1 monooxygenase [Streptomyces monashensis]